MILATDMNQHGRYAQQFSVRATAQNFDPSGKDKNLCLKMILKIADLSYNFRHYDSSKKWTERVYEEYFNQVPSKFRETKNLKTICQSALNVIDIK